MLATAFKNGIFALLKKLVMLSWKFIVLNEDELFKI